MTPYPQKKTSFFDGLNQILVLAHKSEFVKVGQLLQILRGRGSAALLVVLSIPFCTPIQIPGFSTPFGLSLAFLGLRMALGKKMWWPKWILEKNFNSATVIKLVKITQRVLNLIEKILKKRLIALTQNPIFIRINGFIVFILALLLSLPLPIPMTNLLTAIPILCIGLGSLDDDGLFILAGYFFAFVSSIFFITLFTIGITQIHQIFS